MTTISIKSILLSFSLLGLGAATANACPEHKDKSAPTKVTRAQALAPKGSILASQRPVFASTHFAQYQPGSSQAPGQAKGAFRAKRHAKKLAKFDTNKNGVLDPAERTAMQQLRFKKLDGNSDGFISLAEMKAAKREHMAKRQARMAKRGKQGKLDNANKKPRDIAARFASIDSDNNGYISWQEFSQKRMGKGHGKGQRKGPGNRF